MNTLNLRKAKAQGMVEFALVLPLLLLVMFAVIEFGRLLFIYSAVFTASREAARYGAASGSPGDYIAYYRDCVGMRAAARRTGTLAGVQDSGIQIWYDNGTPVSYASATRRCNGTTGPADVNLGDRVVVSVTANYQPILPLVRIPSFAITSRASRTVLKDISISGTPSAPMGSVTVFFDGAESSVDEGDGEIVVRVRISALFSENVWVPFSVTGGTANAADYTVDTPSPVLIRSGATMTEDDEIHITIHPDDLDEEDQETIILTLGTPSNAGVSAPQTHTIKINDDDAPPSVSFMFSGQSINEPNTGSSATAQVFVQLSTVSGRNVSVPFSTDLVSSTATNGTDYVYDTTSPLVIPAGLTTNRIDVRVIGDDMDEEDVETVRVVMGTPVNATPGAITDHTVSIADNDLAPFVRFTWDRSEVAKNMGNVGIQVQLSAASGRTISVPYGLAGSATQGQDYSIQASPLVIPPGNAIANIPVSIYADTLEEPDETITVTLGTPSNASLGSPSVHTMVIKTTVELPMVYFDPGSQEVSEDGVSTTVNVRLSNAYFLDVRVPFAIEGSAQLGIDYQITASPVVIPAGSESVPIRITIFNDTIDELDEVIKLVMGEPTNATMDYPNISSTTILDNDTQPTVYFTSPSQFGNEAVGSMPVTVHLSNIAGVDVMVPFDVEGSATEGSDYTLDPTRMVTIPAGYLERTININVINDDQANGANVGEPDETITLIMGDPVNAVRGTTYDRHTATITAWVCPPRPNNPYFQSGDSKLLVWDFAYSDTTQLNLAQVTISWPTHGGVKLDGITFGSAIGASSYYPNSSGNLMVNTPSPLWSGTFATRQMIFLFSKSPEMGYGSISVTARFQHCPVYSGSISN